MTWAFKEPTVIAANDKIQVKVKILKKKSYLFCELYSFPI